MKLKTCLPFLIIQAFSTGAVQAADYPKAKVSFEDFKRLTAQVESHRVSRLVNLGTF